MLLIKTECGKLPILFDLKIGAIKTFQTSWDPDNKRLEKSWNVQKQMTGSFFSLTGSLVTGESIITGISKRHLQKALLFQSNFK